MANTLHKDRVVRVSDGKYVLPKMLNMKVDAVAFLSDELYAASEPAFWDQLVNASSYEGVTATYAMPDCHVGYGVPVGTVVVTEDTVIQAASGYDISCGILALKVNGARAGAVRSRYDRERWVTEVEKRIATGMGRHRAKGAQTVTNGLAEDVLRFGAKALNVDASLCERQFIPVPDDIDLNLVQKARSKVEDQLGSVGGGNHFIEMQCDRDTGEVFVMVHCGSRGYGYGVADHFFYEAARVRGLSSNRREDAWVRVDEPVGKAYWAHHNSAANFAVANRHFIVNGVMEALDVVFGAGAEVYYEISHNLVQEETLVLPDGTTKKGFVHRKGATRAFPAGHPDLIGTVWEKTGHPCLIPGSMYDGAAILFPKAGAHASACSVNHGSGRILARGEAKRKLGHKQARIDAEMHDVNRTFNGVQIEGIIGNHKHTPLDECAHVYKSLDSVLDVLDKMNIASVSRRLYPIANIKGSE